MLALLDGGGIAFDSPWPGRAGSSRSPLASIPSRGLSHVRALSHKMDQLEGGRTILRHLADSPHGVSLLTYHGDRNRTTAKARLA